MSLPRILRHLCTGSTAVRRRFPADTLAAIEAATAAAERRAGSQIRFAIEPALGVGALIDGTGARERAIEVFSQLRVWDTAHSDGVLIYLLLADRDVEIVADRGAARVTAADWESCCRAMEAEFRAGRFREGALAGIESVGECLARGGGSGRGAGDELPDRPAVL